MRRLALALVPGHLCDGRLYAPQRPALAARAELIEVDATRDDDLGAMAERFLASAPERFAVLGLSMGGMIAMELMARAPERVVGAALLDTDPTPARPKEVAWREDLVRQASERGLEAFVEPFVSAMFGHDPAAGARLQPAIGAMMLDAGAEVFARQARALSTRRDLRAAVAAHAGPLAVIWGAEDRMCPPILHRPMVESASDAVATEIQGCGHISTLEAPEAVTAALSDWLERLV